MEKDIETRNKPAPNRLGNYISGLVFNTLFLILANKIPDWQFDFITPAYTSVLFALNLSFGLQASGNLMLILYRPLPLHYITQVIFNGLSFYASYMLFTVFPLDFSQVGSMIDKDFSLPALNVIFKIIFGIGMAGSVISAVVNLVKYIRSVLKAS